MKSTALQNIKGREGYMPLKIDQTKVSKEKRSEAIVNIGFGRDLKPSHCQKKRYESCHWGGTFSKRYTFVPKGCILYQVPICTL